MIYHVTWAHGKPYLCLNVSIFISSNTSLSFSKFNMASAVLSIWSSERMPLVNFE